MLDSSFPKIGCRTVFLSYMIGDPHKVEQESCCRSPQSLRGKNRYAAATAWPLKLIPNDWASVNGNNNSFLGVSVPFTRMGPVMELEYGAQAGQFLETLCALPLTPHSFTESARACVSSIHGRARKFLSLHLLWWAPSNEWTGTGCHPSLSWFLVNGPKEKRNDRSP